MSLDHLGELVLVAHKLPDLDQNGIIFDHFVDFDEDLQFDQQHFRIIGAQVIIVVLLKLFEEIVKLLIEIARISEPGLGALTEKVPIVVALHALPIFRALTVAFGLTSSEKVLKVAVKSLVVVVDRFQICNLLDVEVDSRQVLIKGELSGQIQISHILQNRVGVGKSKLEALLLLGQIG